MDPICGYQAINVEAQLSDQSSLLHWTRNMIALRKLFRVFGRGSLEFLNPENRKVLAYIRHYDPTSRSREDTASHPRDLTSPGTEIVLCVANLSRFAQPVSLDLAEFAGMVPVEMLGYVPFPTITTTPTPSPSPRTPSSGSNSNPPPSPAPPHPSPKKSQPSTNSPWTPPPAPRTPYDTPHTSPRHRRPATNPHLTHMLRKRLCFCPLEAQGFSPAKMIGLQGALAPGLLHFRRRSSFPQSVIPSKETFRRIDCSITYVV